MNRPQTIITTDMEVDDMNSLIHLCLYLNEFDLLGVIYTSSQYHFLGDGTHTLGEISPNYRCSGPNGMVRPRVIHGPDPAAKDLYDFRPFEKGWIENLWNNQYREAYENLKKHAEGYPTPEYLLSITKYGNIEFEGDVRFDTEGSKMIEEELLKEKEDILYLQSWGGVNTIVRSLLSIYQQYHETDKWQDIYDRIIRRVRLLGVFNFMGQDNSYLDNRINELYPDLVIMATQHVYGVYSFDKVVPDDCAYMFEADWMKKNIHDGNGPLMEMYHLYGDGQYVPGEAELYQFGINSTLDFGKPGIPPVKYEPFTFLAEGDSNTYIPLISFGTDGLTDEESPTLLGYFRKEKDLEKVDRNTKNACFIKAYQEDFAVRAKWCVSEFEDAVHPLKVTLNKNVTYAVPAEVISLKSMIKDYDGKGYTVKWQLMPQYSRYHGNGRVYISHKNSVDTSVIIPADCKPGDMFFILLEARNKADIPTTRYAQVKIIVI
ncbi:MAG: DUF1593 domain-containing protein [Erysipelotrichaceae bacterium]|nr:DUF1593 domain-containing protein [Erysipelotrichaceae bacterium]